jgi:type IV pilus assembly protein PilP
MKRSLLPMCAILLLSACEEQANSALKEWMEQARRDVKPQVQALQPAEIFQSFQYVAGERPDPFDSKKLAAGLFASGGLQPDTERTREPLENYPLESLKMVGSMHRSAKAVGLIEADKVIYQVSSGSHLGQNFGKVITIGEDAITLEELVQDANGNWTQRRTQMAIEEKR